MFAHILFTVTLVNFVVITVIANSIAASSSEKEFYRSSSDFLRNFIAKNVPLDLFVGPFGNDLNDGTSRDSPFKTLSKAVKEAIQRGAAKRGGSITLLKGRYVWEEEDGLVDGLIGPSSTNPFVIKADDTIQEGQVLLDGSNKLPPMHKWKTDKKNEFCTKEGFHPAHEVKELWFTGLIQGGSITGGNAVLGIHAQHPNVVGGDRDSPIAWPVPSNPQERDYPLAGSVWDKSARLGNKNGETLGLLDAEATVLSPPPKCFISNDYSLAGDRCTNGCQQITGSNVKSASVKCPFELPDCPERYHDAFLSHPDPKNTKKDMNDCPSAFPSCDRKNKDATWPWCLDMHNIGYVVEKTPSGIDSSDGGGGMIYTTACVDKKLLGPFPIVAHDVEQRKIYFNYTSLSVNHNAPAKQTPLWEGMTSCWKMDADKIEEITGGKVKTDYFRMEKKPKFKVVARAAFDNELEWWHDGPGEKLCVNIGKSSLENVKVQVKQRGSMLRLQGSENVKVLGLQFFGTEPHAESKNGIGFLNTFDNILVEYPDEIQLSSTALNNSIIRYGKGIIKVTGVVMGSTKKPGRCTFKNNSIEYAEKGVEFTNCAGADIMRNTVHHIYNGDAFEIYDHGCDCLGCTWKSEECKFEVSYNHIHNVGFNGHCDCSGIQTKFGAVKEMQVHHNWIYSLPYHKGIRMDTGENGANIYENMIWNAAKGGMFKGGTLEGHRIVQNTAFGSHDVDLSVIEYELGSGSTTPWKPYNTKSIVYNNAADDWRDSGNRKCTEKQCVTSPGYALKAPKLNKPWEKRWEKCPKGGPIPCSNKWDDLSYWLEEFNEKTGAWEPTGVNINDHGCQSGPLGKYNSLSYGSCKEGSPDWKMSGSWPKVHAMLRDTGNFDFRPPQKGSRLVGSGKPGIHFETNDIGAYQVNGGHYNIPGRVENKSSMPVPPNGAFNVQTDADLMFLRGLNAKKHFILFGKSFCDVATAAPGDGLSILFWPKNIFSPRRALDAGSRYYWRVDSSRKDGTIKKGDVWCFDVEVHSSISPELPWNMRTKKSDCTLMNIEENCEDGNVPTKSPIGNTVAPTMLPTRPSSCEDDMTFRFQDHPLKSCRWAGKKKKRCTKMIVANACPMSCNKCCEDDATFRFKNDPSKSCEWAAKKSKKRCKKTVVSKACPATCGSCSQ